jgi:hypothetical protein
VYRIIDFDAVAKKLALKKENSLGIKKNEKINLPT